MCACLPQLYFIIRHKEDRDIGPTVPLNTLPGNAPGNSMGVGEQYMTESSTYGVINGSTCGADNRRESEAEIQSISDFPQQQLQIYHTQQTQDSSQTEVVPGKVSLRHVLLSCFSGSFADVSNLTLHMLHDRITIKNGQNNSRFVLDPVRLGFPHSRTHPFSTIYPDRRGNRITEYWLCWMQHVCSKSATS